MQGVGFGGWNTDLSKLKNSQWNQRDGHCVVDWLYNAVRFDGNIASKRWFEDRFYDYCGEGSTTEGVDTETVLPFIKTYHKNISVVVLDGTGGIIEKVCASKRDNHKWIGAVSSNNHLNPIDNVSVLKKMMNGKFNEDSTCDLLGIMSD